MPFWVPWPKRDHQGIARYVNPDLIDHLLPEVDRLSLRTSGDYRGLVQAIYARLQAVGIQYAWDKYHPDQQTQIIRAPHEIVGQAREGTCLDLALLFCSICLRCELLPLLIVTKQHALAAVSLRRSLRSDAAWAQRHGEEPSDGLLDLSQLDALLDSARYLAVECTGFARGSAMAGYPTLRAQQDGFLSFDQATQSGRELVTREQVQFVADIAKLHHLGFRPYALDLAQLPHTLMTALVEATSKRTRRELQREERQAALTAAVAAGLGAAAVVLQHLATPAPLDNDLRHLGAFVQRDAVLEELSLLLEPQETRTPDLTRLSQEFSDAGFAPDFCSDAQFEQLIGALIGGFYRAAAQEASLQGAIEITLLHGMVERLGLLEQVAVTSERTADATERTADASELVASLTAEMVQGQRDSHATLAQILRTIEALPGRQFDAYPAIASGLGRANVIVTVDATGAVLTIDERSVETRGAEGVPLLRSVLAQLRAEILSAQAAEQADQLALRRERYCTLLIDLFRDLRLEGLTTSPKPLRLPLERIYVQLRAVAEVPDAADAFSPEERRLLRLLEEAERHGPEHAAELREAQLRLDALRRERWTQDRLERFPISQALSDPAQRGLVILGDPGSGKTTLLQFLALVFAQGPAHVTAHLQIDGPDADRLPIFAPLASYDDMLHETPELTITEFLTRYYDRRRALPGMGPVFAAALAAGQALVLLDGLDEVVDERRRKVMAEQAGAFVQQAIHAGNRVVVTSRIYGYRAAPLPGALPHITVLDFRREEIDRFARQWFRELTRWEHGGKLTPQLELAAQQRERELLADIRTNPGVERLAVNPLLLTMLALLRRQGGRLPQRSIRLYDVYIGALIETWEERRSPGARWRAVQRTDLKEAEGPLIELARWLQEQRPSGTATRADLLAQLCDYYLQADAGVEPATATAAQRRAAETRAERFLSDMRQFSGMLIERGQNAFGFRHLTFQEYFAGRALARMPAAARWTLVQPHLHSSRWREPLLLAAARLGISDAREREASDLVEQILTAGSAYEHLLQRDLLLAADCAADDIGVATPLLRQIVERLCALLDSPVPLLVRAAQRRLYQLTLLRAGEQPKLPEAVAALAAALPVEAVFARYGDAERQELLQALLAEHAELRAPFLARLADDDWQVRAAAVQALGPLLAEHAELRATILARLDDDHWTVRAAAVQALGPLLAEHAELRAPFLACLDDDDNNVRGAAVQALGPLLATHPDLRAPFLARLTDDDRWVRGAAVQALGPLLATHPDLRDPFLARLADDHWSVRRAAVQALSGLLGAHAELRAPILARLDDDDNDVQEAAVQALSGLLGEHAELHAPILARLADDDWQVRATAVEALSGLLGAHAELHAPILARLADDDWQVRAAAVEALSGLLGAHAELRAPIVARLDDEVATVRAAAVQTLSGLLGEHAELRAAIRARLADDDEYVRAAAVATLSSLPLHDPNVTAALRQTLDRREWSIRQQAGMALASHAGGAGESEALLVSLCQNLRCTESAHVQVSVIQALSGLLGAHAELRPPILARLDDDDWQVRAAAVQALSGLLADHAELHAPILARLDDDDWTVRAAAVRALGGLLGEHAELHAPILARLDDDDWWVRRAAVRALSGLLGTHAELRAAIRARLDNESATVRQAAVEALSGLLEEHAELRDPILARLADEDNDVRRAAVEALGPLLAEHADLRPPFLARLADHDNDVRWAAVEALGPLLADHAELRPPFLARLADDDEYVRAAAVRALGPLLATQPELHAPFLARLADHDWQVRRAAVLALGPLLATQPELHAPFLARLADHDWQVREAAVLALGPLLAEHAELHAPILARLADDDWTVRQAAVRALSGLLGDHAELRAPFLARLADDDWTVRQAAVEALSGLLRDHAELRDPILARLADHHGWVRAAAVQALSGLLADHAELRAPILARLADEDSDVRAAAVQAVSGLLADHAELHAPILAHLDDDDWNVRAAVVAAVLPLIVEDALLYQRLLPLAGQRRDLQPESYFDRRRWEETHTVLLAQYAAIVARDPLRRAEMGALLGSADWRQRSAAAQILAAAGPAVLAEAVPQLLHALADQRGLESWPARLSAAELLLNNDRQSDVAIDTLFAALEYDADAIFPAERAAEVRSQAALALGTLKAAYRQPQVVAKVAALFATEKNPQVIDGLYSALTSLVAAPELE